MRDLYKELAEYTERDLNLVQARCQTAHVGLAWLWQEYKDDPIKFYRESDLYIFNLTYYQDRLQKNKIHNWYQYTIKKHGWKTGLDYGGGIGEQTILACEKGVKMTFVEVAESCTSTYAKWRFMRHLVRKLGITPEFGFENFKIKKDYDFINAMDILEHLENPEPVLQDIALHTKWLFCNPEQIKYNWLSPQHISKFNLNLYFKHEDLYLWKRR